MSTKSKSTEPLRLTVELRIPEGSSYEDIAELAAGVLVSMREGMPGPPSPGASMTVRHGGTAVGGIHLRSIVRPG